MKLGTSRSVGRHPWAGTSASPAAACRSCVRWPRGGCAHHGRPTSRCFLHAVRRALRASYAWRRCGARVDHVGLDLQVRPGCPRVAVRPLVHSSIPGRLDASSRNLKHRHGRHRFPLNAGEHPYEALSWPVLAPRDLAVADLDDAQNAIAALCDVH